ncbi:MAG: ArsC/Spx/MgsR family protein [Defluviicoccus sp.]|nr:ArsC/Spx/MgsR family protein [Defluviicoccus sp.]MDG4591277.1 ArsC/Spx/MgsR family protein [Defluviicoccus sp.]MDS4011559.1 ArsC/Spx/MgsR family protein [Defluviicoccus sp.]MDS4073774.1 ArsC/Spx/MgsR family protein [Defluviicoccus sp.]
MVQVIFYMKPGCKGNARQLRVLQASGHDVVVRDLLSEAWTADRLRSFFGEREVAGWFNRSAVRVKSGEIVPEGLTAVEAMTLLLDDPALIRRPLMEAGGERRAGWEPELIAEWIGLGSEMSPGKEGCAGRAGPKATRHHHSAAGCAVAADEE